MQSLRPVALRLLRALESSPSPQLATPRSIALLWGHLTASVHSSANNCSWIQDPQTDSLMANVKPADQSYADSGHEDVYGEDDATKDLPVTPWGRFIAKWAGGFCCVFFCFLILK